MFYPELRVSIRDLWRLCYPLMLAEMSAGLMFYADRIILARLHVDAVNAAAAATLFCLIFQISALGIAGMAEVYVGRLNGAKDYKNLLQPVWQMMFFCLMLAPFFVLISQFAGPYVLAPSSIDYALPYFKWIMATCFIPPMSAACAAYFIAQGESRVVTYSTLVANIVNIILSLALVFGVEGWVKPLGTEGAAIGTVIGQLLQLCILLGVTYIHAKRRGIDVLPNVDLPLLTEMVKIGFPRSMAHLLEIVAWSALYYLAIETSRTHATMLTLAQSCAMLFNFICQGISSSVTAQSANAIGAETHKKITPVLASGLVIQCTFLLALAIPLVLYPEIVLLQFFADESTLMMQHEAEQTLFYLWVFFLFDWTAWTLIGVLTSLKDTWYIMFWSSGSAWLLGFVPCLVLMVFFPDMSPSLMWAALDGYALLMLLAFIWRMRQWHLGGFQKKGKEAVAMD